MQIKIRLKALHDDEEDKGIIEGHGAVFDNKDSFGDVIRKGAFDTAIALINAGKKDLLKMLWQHDTRQPIGLWDKISVDNFGLHLIGHVTRGVSKAEEALLLMRDKVVDGLSIGFFVIQEKFNEDLDVNELLELDPIETSPVTFAANNLARIESIKSVKDFAEYKRFLEEGLLSIGVHRKDAQAIIAGDIQEIYNQNKSDSSSDTHRSDSSELAKLLDGFAELTKNIKETKYYV